MEILYILILSSQLIFTFIAGMYFFQNLKIVNNKENYSNDFKEKQKNLDKLRSISLTPPLSEKTRPRNLNDIKGQSNGIRALRSAICSSSPQHILIYGPAGIGKTTASRLILEEAKNIYSSPFKNFSKFVEIDATTLRFDERSIADPLIGSVHDPIYQGAGAYGNAGIPQPKAGAVTKAHGGILFIDEIGELNSVQMNKLLKVLEDRKVFFSSSYYSEDNKKIPSYIHDIFKNGMPADFRLIGATTRKPEDIPPALRSRCTEIFFNPLETSDIENIARDAFKNTDMAFENNTDKLIGEYATNGRDAVHMVESAVSLAELEHRKTVYKSDIEWIAKTSHIPKIMNRKLKPFNDIGVVNGLAVGNNGAGFVLNIEVSATPSKGKVGKLTTTGITEKEDCNTSYGKISRKSNILCSIENVLTYFENSTNIDLKKYDIHINYSGGTFVDGPSSGIAIYVALYSAIYNIPVPHDTILTGELSIKGNVLPVGGVYEKLSAGFKAGAKKSFIPYDNYDTTLNEVPIEIIPTKHIDEVISGIFEKSEPNIYKKEVI